MPLHRFCKAGFRVTVPGLDVVNTKAVRGHRTPNSPSLHKQSIDAAKSPGLVFLKRYGPSAVHVAPIPRREAKPAALKSVTTGRQSSTNPGKSASVNLARITEHPDGSITMSAQPEMWRVSTIEGVFETDLETLKQWIVEGCVLPTDKVSKGNLRIRIDAGRVPKLKGAFEGVIDIPSASSPQPDTETNQGGWQVPPNETQAPLEPPHETPHSTISPLVSCQNHPGVEPKYVCRACAAMLCAECPRFVGTSKIPVCPLCGDLCHSYTEIKPKQRERKFRVQDSDSATS